MKVKELVRILERLDQQKEIFLDTSDSEYKQEERIHNVTIEIVERFSCFHLTQPGDYVISFTHLLHNSGTMNEGNN
jgi:hypothetical protein